MMSLQFVDLVNSVLFRGNELNTGIMNLQIKTLLFQQHALRCSCCICGKYKIQNKKYKVHVFVVRSGKFDQGLIACSQFDTLFLFHEKYHFLAFILKKVRLIYKKFVRETQSFTGKF